MTDNIISDRLMAAAGKIKKNANVADIGTDHGYLPIYLIENNITDNITAADINEKPLKKAMKNAKDAGVDDKIKFILSDGFDKLDHNELDICVITGMGGYVILKMLKRALENNKIHRGLELVLSPQSDREVFCEFLYQKGFNILSEELIKENNWFYPIFHCVYDGKERETDPVKLKYGKDLKSLDTQVIMEFLEKEKEILLKVKEDLQKAGSPEALKKKTRIDKDLELNEKVYDIVKINCKNDDIM